MGEMPRGYVPVRGGVLAEGGEHDAVLQGHGTDFQGLENFGYGHVAWLRVGGCPCGRNLSWCEIGDLENIRTLKWYDCGFTRNR